jgi:UDP-N-acetylglucosamine diphosphorylase / glucose-1-phosphate thymidylyltransferase / UDP-N-acetylgalactosamine diphosphorylase / glucosamine-1-phosphate N-acetyltransferase / galactosamine-1-phosphate N-acetyltransferase
MKAVILAAGKGNRLRPITATRPKPLIPIAGKPLLEHTILSLKEAGISSILLIVGYKEGMIKEYFKDGVENFGVKIDYITQTEHLGTAHAAKYAIDFVGNDDFLLMYGDILVEGKAFKSIIKEFKLLKPEGIISLIRVENPEEYGIITLDDKGFVENITEKPSKGSNLGNLANAGIYIFTPLIFKAIMKTKKSMRGEYEFTDSMALLISQFSGKIKGYILEDFWSDIGLPWQVLEANTYLLDKLNYEKKGIIEKNVQIDDNVYVGENTLVRSGSYIEGPCFIGKDSLIGPNAFIRPYSFIDDKCHIGMSEIKNSIILSNSNVPHFNYVGDSIICEEVNLGAGTKTSNLRFDSNSIKMNINGKSINSNRRKLGVIIGANSQTGINTSIMCGKKVGENSIIGAHTFINEDVPPNSLYFQNSNGKLVRKSNPFCDPGTN